MSFDQDDATFVVVINDEEQYSIWPQHKPVPAGWQCVGVEGDKATCLAHIEQVWTDMRPKRLRQAMEA